MVLHLLQAHSHTSMPYVFCPFSASVSVKKNQCYHIWCSTMFYPVSVLSPFCKKNYITTNFPQNFTYTRCVLWVHKNVCMMNCLLNWFGIILFCMHVRQQSQIVCQPFPIQHLQTLPSCKITISGSMGVCGQTTYFTDVQLIWHGSVEWALIFTELVLPERQCSIQLGKYLSIPFRQTATTATTWEE